MYNICRIKEANKVGEINKLLKLGWHIIEIRITEKNTPSRLVAVLGWDRRDGECCEDS